MTEERLMELMCLDCWEHPFEADQAIKELVEEVRRLQAENEALEDKLQDAFQQLNIS